MAKQNIKYDSEMATSLVWSPMRTAPTEQGDKSVTTSSAVLFADAASTNGHGARRIRIYNTDGSNAIGLFFLAAGGTATGLSIANSCKLGAGQTLECVISTALRVAAISASGTITVNVLVSDIL
jgi:hypothetical protein